MDVELPEAKGTYILLVSLNQAKRLEIGRLGAFDLVPGFYAYVGSAHGAGGLRARIQHHLESTAEPHWHIDYLLRWVLPIEGLAAGLRREWHVGANEEALSQRATSDAAAKGRSYCISAR